MLLVINFHLFVIIIYVFLALLFLLLISILCFTIYKKRIEFNKKLWQQNLAGVINQAILFVEEEEEEEARIDLTYKIKTLLQNSGFRDYVINELIQIKKSLSGSSTSNLKKLYESLNLDRDSFGKVTELRWHVKAKGLQELGEMEQSKYLKEIFWLTNDENELVRNEAQCAMVSFSGFLGLSFLNVTEYPMSEWQQVQLLNRLNDIKPENSNVIKKWLQSSNESVVVFSLKLAAFYNCNNVYNDVITCLHSSSLRVKITALEYLKQRPQDDTPEQIIKQDHFESKVYNLAVIDVLKDIGSEKQMYYLQKKLHDKDNDIKAAAAKTISCLHPLGNSYLQSHLLAKENPWKSIFLQITNERVA
ncbi:MAG TPA: hypothetical protein VNV85_12880 [Puia sp.]|jgi:hypothetical protein|nr:hypothetical protein [Puia sp.]